MKLKVFFVVLILVAASVCGLLARSTTARPAGVSWNMTTAERLAADGITNRVALLNEGIAKIASGDQALAKQIVEVALVLRQLDRGSDELSREAASSRGLSGVSLVQSGSTWVEAPKQK